MYKNNKSFMVTSGNQYGLLYQNTNVNTFAEALLKLFLV